MLEVTVARMASVTPRIRMLELVAANGADLPAFTAGAHVDVVLGNGEERSYSLLNDPRERHRYILAVLREQDGRGGSAWVHDHVGEGDRLTISHPINNFPLNEAGERHLLIAGGIGVTPLKAMAHHLAAIGADFTLHYCARSREDAAFVEDLSLLLGPRLVTHYDGGDVSRGLDVAKLLKQRPAAAHVYVCGPAGLIRAVREAARHWPKGTVHYELFHGSEADVALRSTDQPFEIMLKRSGKALMVPADKTILDVLKSQGIKIKTLCREGVCGTCRVTLLAGKADHRDEVLTDDERAAAIQVCVSRAMPGEILVLDI